MSHLYLATSTESSIQSYRRADRASQTSSVQNRFVIYFSYIFLNSHIDKRFSKVGEANDTSTPKKSMRSLHPSILVQLLHHPKNLQAIKPPPNSPHPRNRPSLAEKSTNALNKTENGTNDCESEDGCNPRHTTQQHFNLRN